MTQYERDLSNISYTNKDFAAIYPELLSLVGSLSYKWNPVESEESDPGVLLLKLAALMADKNNYNIDKNVLELFPLSVTQDRNARQLYEQCGYVMRHYLGAKLSVSLNLMSLPELSDNQRAKIIGNAIRAEDAEISFSDDNIIITLPRFTMVCDNEKSTIYTLTKSVAIANDHKEVVVNALQGVATEYTINGESLITLFNLDPNNRLYFTETNIAENGIFITNASTENYEDWKLVDNLYLEEVGTRCYKFGIDIDTNRCYIEFPTDIATLMGEGLNITYLITKGFEGNIRKRVIQQFYTNPRVSIRVINEDKSMDGNATDVELTSENMYITNRGSSEDGSNPETIEDAYRNYQRVKTTFDTLVSLKDYTDYLITSRTMSNGLVCDRTNDIESSYRVLNTLSSIGRSDLVVENDYISVPTYTKGEDGYTSSSEKHYILSPKMSAFDLRIYGFQYVGSVNTQQDYITTFSPVDFNIGDAKYSVENALSEVKCINHDFKSYELHKPLLFKNKFPIIAKIVPHAKLTEMQQTEIIDKIKTALYQTVNSKRLAFGEEPSYELIYDTILQADPRIKAIILDDFSYETYVTYQTKDENDSIVFAEMRIDNGATAPSIYEKVADDATYDDSETYYTCAGNTYTQAVGISKFESGKTYYVKQPDPLFDEFRNNILAKSILAGVTPLFVPKNDFEITLQQQDAELHSEVAKVSTEVDMLLKKESTSNLLTYTLQPNENVILTTPNLIKENQYTNYVKFLHNFTSDIPANATYTLRNDEYIIFFYKVNSEDAHYMWRKYTEGAIIKPNFNISSYSSRTKMSADALKGYPDPNSDAAIECFEQLESMGSTDAIYPEKLSGKSLTGYISLLSLSGSKGYVLTTETIDIMGLNKISLPSKVCWSTNRTVLDNGAKKSLLFDTNEYSYLLQPGEYLYYANDTYTQLYLLGSGTLIERPTEKTGQVRLLMRTY